MSHIVSLAGLLVWATTLALPAAAAAESLPAGVRSCTAETDPDRRLACFDREVARFPVPAAKAAAPSAPMATPAAGETSLPSTANVATANTATAPVETSKPQQQPSAKKDSQQRVTARIVTIKRSPSEMLLTLDNGQVWEQMDDTMVTAGRMTNPKVTITRGLLNSFYISVEGVSDSVEIKRIRQ